MPESKSSKKIFICGAACLCIIAAVLIISFISEKFNLGNRNFSRFAAPGIPHIFGTDSMGRDMFIRTVIGFRNTFLLALISQIIPFMAGALLVSYPNRCRKTARWRAAACQEISMEFLRTAPAGAGQAVTCSTSGMGLRLK